MAKVTVTLQPMQYPSNEDKTICMPISEDLIYRALQSIDLPDIHADPFTREMICTSTTKIEGVRIKREDAARLISNAVTKALLDLMGMNDTVMGNETPST